MDKTDIVLCQLLLGNSRCSYRGLVDILNLSVTAVHKRIQDLIELPATNLAEEYGEVKALMKTSFG
jgi:hypothetical protein